MAITNEKKAIDIALKNVVEYHTIDDNGTEHLTHCYKECKKSALEMAKWKDKQFKKEKKQWIEKAVEFIKQHNGSYFRAWLDDSGDYYRGEFEERFYDDFKKAMRRNKI